MSETPIVTRWLLVPAWPKMRARWAVVLRAAARLLRWMLGVPLTVTGKMPADGRPLAAAANHASFVDSLVLVLCLPEPVCFAAGEKFATERVAGPFLRRIGCQFVHRAEPETAAGFPGEGRPTSPSATHQPIRHRLAGRPRPTRPGPRRRPWRSAENPMCASSATARPKGVPAGGDR